MSWIYGVAAVKRNLFPYPEMIGIAHSFVAPDERKSPSTWIKLPESSYLIRGLSLYSAETGYSRLTDAELKTFRPALATAGRHPAGGQAIFRTDARYIRIVGKVADASVAPFMTGIMKNGFDLYINSEYITSVSPDAYGYIDEFVDLGDFSTIKDVTIYLPLYEVLQDFNIFINAGAKAVRINKNKDEKFAVFYGSSITQGCCASNPGMAYPAIVARELKLNHFNLGFSGQGYGDLEVAQKIIGLKPDIVVVDFWANPTAKAFAAELPPFYHALRRGLPATEIYVLAPFFTPLKRQENAEKYQFSRHFVEARIKTGDTRLHFVDGLLREGESAGLVDGRHLNSYGFYLVARRLSQAISAAQLSRNQPDR